jgi:hypothetical protein
MSSPDPSIFDPDHRRTPVRRLKRLLRSAIGRRGDERAGWLLLPVEMDGQPTAPGFEPRHLRRLASSVPVLSYPGTVAARTLDTPRDELCFGIELGGESRAYPVSILIVPHVVNDRVGGERVLVTFCLACYTALAFEPAIDARALTFQIWGVYRGASVLRDDQTGSLWAHLTGECIVGPLAGRRLVQVPGEMALLGAWLERHPDSTALDLGTSNVFRAFRPGELPVKPWWFATMANVDERLPLRQIVVGVEANGTSKAFVLDRGGEHPIAVLNEVGGVPIALLGAPGAWPVAYDRRVQGDVASLRVEGARIVDETGTSWTADGRASNGPRAGSSLPFVRSLVSEWYAWAAHHPDTDIVRS